MLIQNNDQILKDAGVDTLINSVNDPLVALQDQDALNAIVGYLTVYLAQAGSLSTLYNVEAMQQFILHAQRAELLDATFLDASFLSSIRNQVPSPVPTSPPVFLSSPSAGTVNASATTSNAGSYELWHNASPWVKVADGVIDDTTVNFAASGLPSGTQEFRVVGKLGGFAGFAGESKTISIV